MSHHNRKFLKELLVLTTAAYTLFKAYQVQNEEQERRRATRKRRMESLMEIWANESESSSDDECEETPYADLQKFVETTESNDEQQVVLMPQQSNPVEKIKTSYSRTIKRRKVSSAVNGKFVESIVSKFSEKQFKQHFRVSRRTMDKLNECFKSSTEYKNIFKLDDQTKVPANYYMMMFLWFAGKKCSYLELSKIFNVSLSRSVCIVETVLQFLNNCARDYIRFPETPSEKRICGESFQEITELPDVIGCLVNTYIQVRVPLQESKGTSSSFEEITSTIQAVCDSKGRFFDVFVDATHKVHHTKMLQASPINEKLKEICQGRYHLIAAGEHHIREWLLTPYKEPVSSGQEIYNRKHKSTLQGASESLEALKSRFKQLTNMPSFSTYKIKKMIVACCVLQNICLEEDDCYDFGDPLAIYKSNDEEETLVVAEEVADDAHLRRIGELKRKQIMEDLKI